MSFFFKKEIEKDKVPQFDAEGQGFTGSPGRTTFATIV